MNSKRDFKKDGMSAVFSKGLNFMKNKNLKRSKASKIFGLKTK